MNIKGCYKVIARRYFIKDEFKTLKEIYWEWYKQRLSNKWEDFNI